MRNSLEVESLCSRPCGVVRSTDLAHYHQEVRSQRSLLQSPVSSHLIMITHFLQKEGLIINNFRLLFDVKIVKFVCALNNRLIELNILFIKDL